MYIFFVAGYPNTLPVIIVQSQHEDLAQIVSNLEDEADRLRGKPMLLALVDLAKSLLSTNEPMESETVHKHSKQKSKKKHGHAKSLPDQQLDKKAPMKTATDVINRLLWDSQVNKCSFIVGYVDRFVGVLEKNFTEFSWEDIAAVDYNVLAIPRHRINYFKYKGVKVWDKHERLDNVFGSTGSGLTITDVMTQTELKELEERENQQDVNCSSNEENYIVTKELEESVELCARSELKSGSNRPTHFLCFHVNADEIVQRVAMFHSYIDEEMPIYSRLLVPTSKLHVTLLALDLHSPEKLSHAKQLLNDLQHENQKPANVCISLSGISDHQGRVIYAKVEDNPGHKDFQRTLSSVFSDMAVDSDFQESNWHLSLLRLRKSDEENLDLTQLNLRVFKQVENMKFGQQNMQELLLCEMASLDKVSFYNVVSRVNLQQ